jgi:hypothetical protein
LLENQQLLQYLLGVDSQWTGKISRACGSRLTEAILAICHANHAANQETFPIAEKVVVSAFTDHFDNLLFRETLGEGNVKRDVVCEADGTALN